MTHHGYITFETYEHNQATLAVNAAARGDNRRAGPVREGPALLQGLVVCGKCGKRITVSYHARCNGELLPDYHCSREGIATGTHRANRSAAPASTPQSPRSCSTPSSRPPSASTSAQTRAMIAPIVRHAIRVSSSVAVFEVLTASHAT